MALEIVSSETLSGACHLLKDSENYKCDTVDLREDTEARVTRSELPNNLGG